MASAQGPQQAPPKPELWGFPGFLTPEQQRALEELKRAVQRDKLMGTPHADEHFLRFLRARDFDVGKALAMVRDDLEWRRAFEGVHFTVADYPSLIKFMTAGVLYRAGYDKDGRPVIVTKLALLFPKEVSDVQEIARLWVSYVHFLNQECEEQGVVDYTAIADLAGFSPAKNFSLALTKVLVDILQRFHPDRRAYAFVVNAPSVFRILWQAVAPLLEARTKAKIHILGSNPKVLQEYVSADQLEPFLGGTHAPWPVPDHIVQRIQKDGVTIRTGLFDGLETPADNDNADDAGAAAVASTPSSGGLLSKTMSSKRVQRMRNMLARFDTMGRLKGAPKAAEMPKQAPRVTVFGATGRTGLIVVQKCLKAGWDVCAFVRLDGKGAPPALLKAKQEAGGDRLQIVVGSVFDPNDLDRAIETSDVVVSCMGTERSLSNQGGEWFVDTARKIVEAMERNGTRRLVVVTAAQAKRMSKAWYDANASLAQNAARALYWESHYTHIAEMEKFIQSRTDVVDFTFVRPAQLDEEGAGEKYVVEDDAYFVSGAALPRPALAEFIVKECVLPVAAVGPSSGSSSGGGGKAAIKHKNVGVALAGVSP